MMFEINRMRGWVAICVCALALGPVSVFGFSEEAILKPTPESFDFGTIPEGPPAVTVASIENTSGVPVEITNLTTS
jgi:hypothetical protein